MFATLMNFENYFQDCITKASIAQETYCIKFKRNTNHLAILELHDIKNSNDLFTIKNTEAIF